MRTILHALATAVLVAAVFGSVAQAQSYDPIQAEMARLQAQLDASIAANQRRIMELQQQADAEAIAYYRHQTGDHRTPDAVAIQRGRALYCENHPVECRQAAEGWSAVAQRGHEMRMNDIASWGRTARGIGRTNSEILDMSHQGHMNRQDAIAEGQAGVVQGAIQGQWTYGDPSTGMGYDLPVWPDPQMRYATPEGRPLSFDYRSETWYVGGADGFWRPLQPRR